MFTGLVRCLGTVRDVTRFGNGRRFKIDIGALAETLAIGQSVAVNGACLSVTALNGTEAGFDATRETVERTNLLTLRAGTKVNLEPAMQLGDALDGHIMLGHVDAMGTVLGLDTSNPDNRVVTLSLPPNIRHLVAEKGSVAVDGISLTVATAGTDRFTVAVIPITWRDTTLAFRGVGDGVNLEADVLARYTARFLECGGAAGKNGVSEDLLRNAGFF